MKWERGVGSGNSLGVSRESTRWRKSENGNVGDFKFMLVRLWQVSTILFPVIEVVFKFCERTKPREEEDFKMERLRVNSIQPENNRYMKRNIIFKRTFLMI